MSGDLNIIVCNEGDSEQITRMNLDEDKIRAIFKQAKENKMTSQNKVAEKLHYRIKFDLTSMTDDQKHAVSEASAALGRAGISFDQGSDGLFRYWEFDWSLKGHVSIEARKPIE